MQPENANSKPMNPVMRTTVDAAKPAVRAVVSMVANHPEAATLGVAGYFVGKQVERIWGVKHLTGGTLPVLLALAGGIYGYNRALIRRSLDLRNRPRPLKSA